MRICVVGGAGYVGSKLVPRLLQEGYAVTVLDLYLYGKTLEAHPLLKEVVGDMRDLHKVKEALVGCQAVIHLACISNDPSFELDPALGKSINFDAFEPFVIESRKVGIGRFIYASSSSVYGVKQESNVHEGMSLEPLTDYSRFKAACEEVLFKYTSDTFLTTVVRPATVCGYSPRQRLDLVVNILTNFACTTGKIKVMGGAQMRPNIHIDDMVDVYLHLLTAPGKKVQGQIFNAGTQNHTVAQLGELVAKIVGNVDIEVVPTNDNRSYHISSEKIERELGWKPLRSIEGAVEDLAQALRGGKLPNSLEDKQYFNIKMMQSVHLR